ncbi:hypothetical protein P9112_012762 [Eukaryota sp. TZLM1-RC]
MSSRQKFIGGNWKCNGTVESVKSLVETLNKADLDQNAQIVVCPPSIHIPYAKSTIQNKIEVGAQDVSQFGYGAYTGSINAEMLKDFGLNWAIIGHSERRSYFGETDELAAEKAVKAISAGLSIIFCFGESLDDYNAGKTNEIIKQQLRPLLSKVTEWDKVVLAFEPVWSIGTGVVCPTHQAQATHDFIRNMLKEEVSAEVAEKMRIIYGGSVKAANCADLYSQPDIDGFLVGGASLKPEFVDICNVSQ